METWYLCTGYITKQVIPVQVVKSTDKTVWVMEKRWLGEMKEHRHSIRSEYDSYFRTAEDAWDHAIKHAQNKREYHAEQMNEWADRVSKALDGKEAMLRDLASKS